MKVPRVREILEAKVFIGKYDPKNGISRGIGEGRGHVSIFSRTTHLNGFLPVNRLSSQGWGKEKAGRKRIEDRGGGETVDKATLKLTSYSPASAWMYWNVRRSCTIKTQNSRENTQFFQA